MVATGGALEFGGFLRSKYRSGSVEYWNHLETNLWIHLDMYHSNNVCIYIYTRRCVCVSIYVCACIKYIYIYIKLPVYF